MTTVQANASSVQECSSRLTRQQVKTLAISMLGGGLEYYEFLVFVFMIPTLGKVFFAQATESWLVQLQTLGIFAAGYLVRPLGGIVLGSLGDKFGRKRMFIVTLALMAAPTLAIGLLPSYAQIGVAAPIALLLCRFRKPLQFEPNNTASRVRSPAAHCREGLGSS